MHMTMHNHLFQDKVASRNLSIAARAKTISDLTASVVGLNHTVIQQNMMILELGVFLGMLPETIRLECEVRVNGCK
jgi:hypothetical protein